MANLEERDDKEIIHLLENLLEAPPRDQRKQAEGRASFLQAAMDLRASKPVSWEGAAPGFWKALAESLLRPLRMAPRFAAAAALVAIALLSGTAITVSAASQAQPGQRLYAVKLWLEQAQLAFTFSALGDLHLSLAQARLRIDEIQALGSFNSAAYQQAMSELAASLARSQKLYDSLLAGGNTDELDALGVQLEAYWDFFNSLDPVIDDADETNRDQNPTDAPTETAPEPESDEPESHEDEGEPTEDDAELEETESDEKGEPRDDTEHDEHDSEVEHAESSADTSEHEEEHD